MAAKRARKAAAGEIAAALEVLAGQVADLADGDQDEPLTRATLTRVLSAEPLKSSLLGVLSVDATHDLSDLQVRLLAVASAILKTREEYWVRQALSSERSRLSAIGLLARFGTSESVQATRGIVEELKSLVGAATPDPKIAHILNLLPRFIADPRQAAHILLDCIPSFRGDTLARETIALILYSTPLDGTLPTSLATEVGEYLRSFDIKRLATKRAKLVGEAFSLAFGSSHEDVSINNVVNYHEFVQSRDPTSPRQRLKRTTKLPASHLTKVPPSPPPPTGDTTGARPSYLASVLANLPEDADYLSIARVLETAAHDFRKELLARLKPALVTSMLSGSHPSENHGQKKLFVAWVNAELRRFDAAIKSPKTGLPAVFKAKQGNHPATGIFQLIGTDPDGTERTFSTSELAVLIENFELMEAAPRREPLAEWRERTRPRGEGSGRG